MADKGLRIADEDKNVFTDPDEDMVFSTKYSIPKAKKYEEFDLDSIGNPALIAHEVAAVPFILPYGTADGSNKVLGFYFNIYDINNVAVIASADTTNARIHVSGSPPNKKCYLYAFHPEI